MRGFNTEDGSREHHDFNIGGKSSESNYFFKTHTQSVIKKTDSKTN